MKSKRNLFIFLILFHLVGCCYPQKDIVSNNKDFETVVMTLFNEIQKALDNANSSTPGERTFLDQTGFERDWKQRTLNWERQLNELEKMALAANKEELAERAALLNSLISQLPESGERFRKKKLDTLRKRSEKLKEAL